MKTLFFKMTLMAAVLTFTGPDGYSQQREQQIPAPVQNLMKFIGRWESHATIASGDKTYKVIYWVTCRKTAGGNGIYMDEGFTIPETGNVKGADLAGYDPFDLKIKWFSVDNMGTTHQHVGEWVDSNHLFIEYDAARDGKQFVEKIDFIFKTPDVLDFKLIGTLDGVETEREEGIFYKKPSDVK
jgi:hypothetical protein